MKRDGVLGVCHAGLDSWGSSAFLYGTFFLAALCLLSVLVRRRLSAWKSRVSLQRQATLAEPGQAPTARNGTHLNLDVDLNKGALQGELDNKFCTVHFSWSFSALLVHTALLLVGTGLHYFFADDTKAELRAYRARVE